MFWKHVNTVPYPKKRMNEAAFPSVFSVGFLCFFPFPSKIGEKERKEVFTSKPKSYKYVPRRRVLGPHVL